MNAPSAAYVPAAALMLAVLGGIIAAPLYETPAAPAPKQELRRVRMTLSRPASRMGSGSEAGLNGFRLAPMEGGMWTPIPTPESAPEPLVMLNFLQ